MNTSGMDRRTWLRSVAAANGAAAAAQLFPGISFGARIPSNSIQDATWKKTPCRFCGTGCGLLVGISNGKAIAVKGDPESSVNKGLCCVKGYHSVMALYGSDRLTKAMVRRNGKLVPVPISEALDLVAKKMTETIATQGKDSGLLVHLEYLVRNSVLFKHAGRSVRMVRAG